MSTKDNGSETPSTSLPPKTGKSLLNITFTEKDIDKVTQNLDSNKADGQHTHLKNDMISIRILKLCRKSVIKHRQICFKQ